MSGVDAAKRLAACTAVDDWLASLRPESPSPTAIGIGSGSTIVHVVDRIADLVHSGQNLALASAYFVPSSFQARQLIVSKRLQLGDLDRFPELDVAFDGADEVQVDAKLSCIKGGGGAMFQEKVVANSARRFIVVADYRKASPVLGRQWRKGLPLEVAPFALAPVMNALKRLNAVPTLRMAVAKAGPVVTDNANFIVDAEFGDISDAAALDRKLQGISGIVETGLFVDLVDKAYFGQADGTVCTHDVQR